MGIGFLCSALINNLSKNQHLFPHVFHGRLSALVKEHQVVALAAALCKPIPTL